MDSKRVPCWNMVLYWCVVAGREALDKTLERSDGTTRVIKPSRTGTDVDGRSGPAIRARGSGPAEVNTSHLVELFVERSIEIAQPLYDLRIDERMGPTLRLAETPGASTSLGLLEARETLRCVEVEVFVGDDPLQRQEVLHHR